MEAHAHALRGESKQCAHSLQQGEAALGHANRASTPEWLRYFDEAYFAARAAHCFSDLLQWAECEVYARQALFMAEGLKRAHVFNVTVLASAYIDTDVYQACAIGREALESVRQLRSGRAVQYVQNVQRDLNVKHSREPVVLQFNEFVTTAMGGV